MKYAQIIMGLLIGTALGGTAVAINGKNNLMPGNNAMNADAIKKIVRETISEEPKLILDSVQKFQEAQRAQGMASASQALKDPAVHALVYDTKNVGIYGPKDGKRVVVQFFDYNCPACKAQHQALAQLVAKDKDITILFREYPIFGPTSERNSHLGLAVAHLAPEKYYAFYEKMMSHKGHAEEKDTLNYIKELGLDVEKVKAEADKPSVAAALAANRMAGEKIHIQGTPTLVIGDEVIPHAMGPEDLEQKLATGK